MPAQRVQSLDRALDLLEALAAADELGVSEIAAKTGLVPSTAHRLLATLVARGYAAQSPNSGRYLLGYKLPELTSGPQDRLQRPRAAARPTSRRSRRRRARPPTSSCSRAATWCTWIRSRARGPCACSPRSGGRSPRTRAARARRCSPGATR